MFGQNLVKNPGFEKYHHLPDSALFEGLRLMDTVFSARYWHRPPMLTPNYFHVNSKHADFGIPHSFLGYHPALDGSSAHIGAVVLSLQDISIPFSGELTEPLVEGQKYRISFYYRFAHLKSYFLLDKMEAYISLNNWITELHGPHPFHTDITVPFDTVTFRFHPIIANVTFQPITNDGQWHRAVGYFTAKGGERYISIGIFFQSEEFFDAINTYVSFLRFSGLSPRRRDLRRFYRRYQDVLCFIHRNPLFSPAQTDRELRRLGYTSRSQWAYYFFDNISVEAVQAEN